MAEKANALYRINDIVSIEKNKQGFGEIPSCFDSLKSLLGMLV